MYIHDETHVHNQVMGTNLDTLHPLEFYPAAVLQIWPSYMALLLPHLLLLGPVDRMPLHPSLLDQSLLPRQQETDEHGSVGPDPVRQHSTKYLLKHHEAILISNKETYFIS